MSPVRASTAALLAVATAVLSFAALRAWVDAGRPFPHPSLLELVALALIGGTLLALGRRVRRMALGLPGRDVEPLTAARTFVLAQASTLTGAVLAGVHTGAVGVLWETATGSGSWGGLVRSAALALAAAVLVLVGLVVQGWCRRPDTDGPTGEEPGGAAGA